MTKTSRRFGEFSCRGNLSNLDSSVKALFANWHNKLLLSTVPYLNTVHDTQQNSSVLVYHTPAEKHCLC